jgi:hypothetical protein
VRSMITVTYLGSSNLVGLGWPDGRRRVGGVEGW